MNVLYKFKTVHPVKVVSHYSNKIMEPRTKQTVTAMIRPRSKKYLILLVMGSLVPPLLIGGKNFPPSHMCGNNKPIA